MNANNKSKKKKNELHKMIMKEAQQWMQTMFKQMHQQHRSDDDSDINESHHIEVMEDITVSECYNLSDLCQPPTKKNKTQHFAPNTTAVLGMHLGKSSIHKLRVLFEPADLDKIACNCDYLTDNKQMQLLSLLHKYQHLFEGPLGTWNAKPFNIELKPNAKPYHSRPFPVPKIYEVTLKIEFECLHHRSTLFR
jgi:hypothetical protein